MLHPLHIIAATSDENFGKLVIFGIIAIIWAIGHFANWVKNAGAKPNVRPQPRPPVVPPAIPALKQALRSAPARPVGKLVAPARLMPQQRQAVFSKRPVPPPLPPRARVLRQAPAFVPQPVQAPQAPRPAPAPRAPAPAPAMPSVQSPRPAFAASLNRWLKPNTLQKQFVITEIFQPPLGLRDQMQGEI